MKRIFLILLGGLLCVQASADDYSIIEQNNRKGLMDQRGKILIPPQFDELGWSKGPGRVVDEVIGYKMGEFWGLISVKNIKITTPEFIEMYPFDDYLLIAGRYDSYKLRTEYGLISYTGKTIIDFNYSLLKDAGENLIAVRKKENRINYGLLDNRGKVLIPFHYKKIDYYPPDILILQDQDQCLQVCNKLGTPVLKGMVDEVNRLDQNYLWISARGKAGLVSTSGRVLCRPEYSDVKIGNNGSISIIPVNRWKIVTPDNQPVTTLDYDQVIPLDRHLYKTSRKNFSFIINDRGEEIFSIRNSDIRILNDSLATIKPELRYGVINYRGDLIIPAVYDSIEISGDRLFLQAGKGSNRAWQMADLSGRILTSRSYGRIYHLNRIYLAVKKRDFWGIANLGGQELVEAIYDSIYSYNRGHFLVNFHGEKGVVDLDGNWSAYPRPGDLFMLDDDSFLVSSLQGSVIIDFYGNELFRSSGYLKPLGHGFLEIGYRGKSGLINSRREQILPVDYDSIAEIIPDSIYLFRNENGFGTVDHRGRFLFSGDRRFEQVLGCHENFIGVQIDGKYGFVDLEGKLRIANRYEGIGLFHDGLANISLLGKWGCVDKKESLVIQPYYDKIFPFKDGLAIACKDNRYGIIDSGGDVRISFEYDSLYRLHQGGFICTLNEESGLINNQGLMRLLPKFDEIRDLQNGYIMASRKRKFGVFNSEGVITIPFIYDRMQFDELNNVMLISVENSWEKLSQN